MISGTNYAGRRKKLANTEASTKASNTKLSKLHRRIRKQLKLSKLGFRSERWIGRYRVDEVNFKKKLVVEINGDAVHGNPRKFFATDRLLYGQIADRKWTKDCRRQDYLERRGFRVIVIWESDNLLKKRDLIRMVMRLYH